MQRQTDTFLFIPAKYSVQCNLKFMSEHLSFIATMPL